MKRTGPALIAFCLFSACSNEDRPPDPPVEADFRPLASGFPGAALAVDGTAADDVWVVGASTTAEGLGPLLTHFDGSAWTSLDFDPEVNLWWVDAVTPNLTYAAGTRGTIIRITNGTEIERMPTPGRADHVVFGLWARSADDAYAVGEGKIGREGFVWRWDGQSWRSLELPPELASPELGNAPSLFKVWGNDEAVWVVGSLGTILRSTDGETFEVVEIPDPASSEGRLLDRLFTVHGRGDQLALVGGGGQGIFYSLNEEGAFVAEALPDPDLIQGVYFGPNDSVVAVGARGRIYERRGETWTEREANLENDIESLHAVWIDPEGGVWAVGGNVLGSELDEGVVVVAGRSVDNIPAPVIPEPPPPSCPVEQVQPEPDRSIARQWIEHLLNAIRRDIPEPTVHARNLYHLSAAMYDIWAAFDDTASQTFIDERLPMPADRDAFLETAISFAGYRILTHRYASAAGGPVTVDCLDRFMDLEGYDTSIESVQGDSPEAFGNRVAAAIIEFGRTDGANEQGRYQDPNGYVPSNPILVVAQPGTTRPFEADELDPAIWQPLRLPEQRTQNDIPLESDVQEYIGPHWRGVTPFALERPSPGAPYFDGGEGPGFGPHLIPSVVELIEKEALLDVDAGIMIDVSPASYGNNSLGANDGQGYATNPFTGEPYEPSMVNQADFGRLMAEYWADGPNSETPPGHWNSIAHFVTDDPDFEPLFEGNEPIGMLEYDVKLHLALNGALHDAAIVAWELKRQYESSRPITLIRHMASLGQSTEAEAEDYDPAGLPLIDGLIERITAESTASGERHVHLRPYVGELAVRGWLGEPGDPDNEYSGVGWIRAADWVPYQARTFVSPAFPGYTSGHSTFSRAAAEVLTNFTGSPWFPGGLQEFFIGKNTFLKFEEGPSTDVRLQFAQYYDAADQAGQSRIWGGIHIEADDFVGRTTGSQAGIGAYNEARALFFGQP